MTDCRVGALTAKRLADFGLPTSLSVGYRGG